MTTREQKRQFLQEQYDASHSQLERNMKGQFATPRSLAMAITKDALSRVDLVRTALEPSCGTGAFVSCLRECEPNISITGIEKDPAVFDIASKLWSEPKSTIIHSDFFDVAELSKGYDLLVTNPPYSRHHHLSSEEKNRYGSVVEKMTGKHLSQLAGLHAYFILAGTNALRSGGVASWLIPSELFSVNYGSAIRDYITSQVSVERVHFFDNGDLQFNDALVSSCVLILRKKPAADSDAVSITFGDFDSPMKTIDVSIGYLRHIDKWQHLLEKQDYSTSSTIGDFFKVKRGLSTGAESFYSKQREEWHNFGIADDWLIPVLPAPRNMHDSLILGDCNGWPLSSDRALLNIPLSVPEDCLPGSVLAYLANCPDKVRNSYTAKHRKRWYSIEQREPAPIVCTYMSRSNAQPFRFIRNKTSAVVTTAYLCLYPRRPLTESQLDYACNMLNSIEPSILIASGREYGGGLRKLEPKELLSVPFDLSLSESE